jgi:hypothetical protein
MTIFLGVFLSLLGLAMFGWLCWWAATAGDSSGERRIQWLRKRTPPFTRRPKPRRRGYDEYGRPY